MKEVTLIVKVKAPNRLSDAEVAALVNRLLTVGKEEAACAPDDYDDPDVENIGVLRISRPRVFGS